AGGGEEPQFGGFIGEPEQRLIRVEECPRMRLEGECGSRFTERERARKRRRYHGFMSAMHAVEIADGDGRSTQRPSRRKVAQDAEGLRRHRAHQISSRITPRGLTPPAANIALSAARSGAWREPYSSAWIR